MVSRGPAWRGMQRCAIAAALFGATTPLASRLADDVSAPMLAGLLYAGAALAVAPVAGRRAVDATAVRRGFGRLGVAVVAGGFAGPLLLAAGLSRTPAATASLLLNLELPATVVLAALLFREHLGPRVLGGAAAVVGGGVLLVWTDAPELRLGALLIAGACLFWGIDNCVTADLGEISAEHITIAKGLVAGTTNIAIGVGLDGSLPPAGVAAAALLIGGIGYGASITLWVSGARELGAARGQLVFSAAPFIGVFVAWLALGDAVRPAEVAAVLLAAFGVSRVAGSHHDHGHAHLPLDHDHEHAHDDGHHVHDHRSQGDSLADDLHSEDRARTRPDGRLRRHAHRHRHPGVVHAHPHLPDLHHRHGHGSNGPE